MYEQTASHTWKIYLASKIFYNNNEQKRVNRDWNKVIMYGRWKTIFTYFFW